MERWRDLDEVSVFISGSNNHSLHPWRAEKYLRFIKIRGSTMADENHLLNALPINPDVKIPGGSKQSGNSSLRNTCRCVELSTWWTYILSKLSCEYRFHCKSGEHRDCFTACIYNEAQDNRELWSGGIFTVLKSKTSGPYLPRSKQSNWALGNKRSNLFLGSVTAFYFYFFSSVRFHFFCSFYTKC